MGDYYKIKKILLILIIICTILRIINNSKVFGAQDVNSSIQSGNYVVQTDNHFYTYKDWVTSTQSKHCFLLLKLLKDENTRQNTYNTISALFNIMQKKDRTIFFFTDVNSLGFYYQEILISSMTNSNITISGVTIDNSYNFNNMAFINYPINSNVPTIYISPSAGTRHVSKTSGSGSAPIPALGFLSPYWADVFKEGGLIGSSGEYESLLTDIENNQQLSLQQEQMQSVIMRDTNNVVTNSYNYIKDENIDELTSLGFSSPDVEEKIDLNDVFDQFEALLTDENYHPKQFSFWLPNGDENVFSISPTMLEDNLTRVGGGNIIQIIHAIWFISLYAWYIFAYFGILGKLISGDWFHLVRGQSPVTRMVKFSVGSITGNARF